MILSPILESELVEVDKVSKSFITSIGEPYESIHEEEIAITTAAQ